MESAHELRKEIDMQKQALGDCVYRAIVAEQAVDDAGLRQIVAMIQDLENRLQAVEAPVAAPGQVVAEDGLLNTEPADEAESEQQAPEESARDMVWPQAAEAAEPEVQPAPDDPQLVETPSAAEPEPVKKLFCKNCGSRIKPQSRFCMNCGQRL